MHSENPGNRQDLEVAEYITKMYELKPWEQFLWGCLGGVVLVGSQFLIFIAKRSEAAVLAGITREQALLASLVIIAMSGIISRACSPHHRFVALWEGASGPALFILVAKELHFTIMEH
jgi:hypothetical protein